MRDSPDAPRPEDTSAKVKTAARQSSGHLRYADVENANALRKLRALMKMDRVSFAKFLGIPEDALTVLEDLESRVPSHLLVKAAGQVGITSSDMGNRLDKMIDKDGFDYKDLAPDHIPASEIFDLINLYCLTPRKNERLNVLSILKMLACDRPDTNAFRKVDL